MRWARLSAMIAVLAMLLVIVPSTAMASTTSSTSGIGPIPIVLSLDDAIGPNSLTLGTLSLGGAPLVPGPTTLKLKGKANGKAWLDLRTLSLNVKLTSLDVTSDPLVLSAGCPSVKTAPIRLMLDPASQSTATASLKTSSVSLTLNAIARAYLTADGSACGEPSGTFNYADTKASITSTGSMKIKLYFGTRGLIGIGTMTGSASIPDMRMNACLTAGASTDPCPAAELLTFDPTSLETKLASRVSIPLR